jgi:hypothetical protein
LGGKILMDKNRPTRHQMRKKDPGNMIKDGTILTYIHMKQLNRTTIPLHSLDVTRHVIDKPGIFTHEIPKIFKIARIPDRGCEMT